MAHHQSAKKRIRQDEKKRLHNRYYKKSTRTAIKKVREMEDQGEAEKQLPALFSMIDRLAKRNLFHPNKAANLKSGLAKHIKSLG
jgi:small subunit ribosomal protein S20